MSNTTDETIQKAIDEAGEVPTPPEGSAFDLNASAGQKSGDECPQPSPEGDDRVSGDTGDDDDDDDDDDDSDEDSDEEDETESYEDDEQE